jgi:hypothetical protein
MLKAAGRLREEVGATRNIISDSSISDVSEEMKQTNANKTRINEARMKQMTSSQSKVTI